MTDERIKVLARVLWEIVNSDTSIWNLVLDEDRELLRAIPDDLDRLGEPIL